MDVLKRIDEIMRKQHLNDYQLSKLSGLSTSTISNMRKRNTIPSIAILEYICDSFDMTLSQFFVDEGTLLYPVNDTQKDFLDYFILLTEEQQQLVLEVVKNMQANYHEKIDRQKEKLEQRKIAASQMDTENHFESVTAEENGIAE
jgi:transcriptional regulator with XRE-family HTH domain